MDRNEAINLFKEIQSRIAELCPKAVTLTESEPNNPLFTGYAIHLTGLCEEHKKQTIKISSEHGLAAKEDKDELTIFTPKPAKI